MQNFQRTYFSSLQHYNNSPRLYSPCQHSNAAPKLVWCGLATL